MTHSLMDSRNWLAALLVGMLLTMPGCSGCKSKPKPTAKGKNGKKAGDEKKDEDEDEKKDESKKKPKKDFEAVQMRIQPTDPDVVLNFYKPGHWLSTQQAMRANNFDFPAEVVTRSMGASDQSPMLIDGTLYSLKTTRSTSLAKGQAKYVETLSFAPPKSRDRNMMLSMNLLQRRTRTQVFADSAATTRMPEHQYLFVILSSMPDNLTYIKTLHAIEPPLSSFGKSTHFYRVLAPRIDRRVAVPSHSLTWSSIAYVLWDRVNVELMTPLQKEAMIDWLHWGGQLIISGPDNLDYLKTSFLGDYLPADMESVAEFTNEDFDEINQHYGLYSKKRKAKQIFELLPDEKLVGVQWKLRPESNLVPKTGGLVAERPVGRGRVVVSAFSLGARHFKRWAGADNFFNGSIMRRPGRRFFQKDGFMPTMEMLDAKAMDPRLGSNVRYFSRDIPPIAVERSSAHLTEDDPTFQQYGVNSSGQPTERYDDANPIIATDQESRFEGYAAWRGHGNAGWNDRSGVSIAARQSLRTAAGIEVPKAKFVLQAVGIYLLVLVPLNWLVFRLMGRVEWAWVAAPLIAVIGSVFVVRQANVNIGFARRVTEAAVLELQAGYNRGHLTRYTALYSSLATNYEMTMDGSSSLSAPFAAKVDRTPRLHERRREVTLTRGANVTLKNYQVDSNSTGMLHTEQMCDVGPLSLRATANGQLQLVNGSTLSLKDAMVLRRTNGRMEACYLAEIEPETNRPLTFEELESGAEFEEQFAAWSDATCAFSPLFGGPGEVGLHSLARLAVEELTLREGEARLIAWTDQPVEGMVAKPIAETSSYHTMVLAHLQRMFPGDPGTDKSLMLDIAEEDGEVLDLLNQQQP